MNDLTTVHLIADPASVPLREALALAAEGAPVMILTGRAFIDLAADFDGDKVGAATWLAELAGRIKRPIGINYPTSAGTSTTFWLAPPGWTTDVLTQWVTGHRDVIEAEYGPATLRPLP